MKDTKSPRCPHTVRQEAATVPGSQTDPGNDELAKWPQSTYIVPGKVS